MDPDLAALNESLTQARLRRAKEAGFATVEEHEAAREKSRQEAAEKAEASRKEREAKDLAQAKAAGFDSVAAWKDDIRRRLEDDERKREAERLFYAVSLPLRQREAIESGAKLLPAQEAIADAVLPLLRQGAIIAIIGPRGTGKTHLAVELTRRFLLQGSRPGHIAAKYAKAMELFRDLKATFDRYSGKSEKAVIRGYVDPRLLILDEVQERTGSDWELTQLTDILDQRYTCRLPTLLISNLTRGAMAQSLGPSICSRLREDGDVFELAGESVREAIRKGAM